VSASGNRKCVPTSHRPGSRPRRGVRCPGWCLGLGFLAATTARLWGLVFVATADPEFHTAPPGGDLAGSGWQYQGEWQSFTGTPIAPSLFLTAQHVGGAVGDPFTLGGRTYATLAVFPDPESDLTIWQVCGAFPEFAPLYTDQQEVGSVCVLFGRGLGRGDPVWQTNGPTVSTSGWLWGGGSGRLRWGKNEVASVVEAGAGLGSLLKATFDAAGGPEEATLAAGDSGGGVFMRVGQGWALAGIAYAVDGPFRRTLDGPTFSASLTDMRGFYAQTSTGDWSLIPRGPSARPGGLYATRVSARRAWIQSVIAAHDPEAGQPTLLASETVDGEYREAAEVEVDLVRRTMSVPVPVTHRFYRLRHCQPVRLRSITRASDRLELTYD